MMTELFSNAWAVAWGRALNGSEAYRHAGKSWEGALVLEAHADPARGLPHTAAVFLDLWRGTCREARVATAADELRASHVLSGPLGVWLTVLNGDMAPTVAILRGKLKLKRGSLAGLLPHVHAATELVRVAQHVTPHATPHLTPHPTPHPTPHLTPHVTPHVTPHATQHVTQHVTQHGDTATITAESGAESIGAESISAESSGGESSSSDSLNNPLLSAATGPRVSFSELTTRAALQSTSPVGLRYDLFPMKLWDKAKRLGIWNPADIDFTQDRIDWQTLAPDEQDMLLRLTTLFQAGLEFEFRSPAHRFSHQRANFRNWME